MGTDREKRMYPKSPATLQHPADRPGVLMPSLHSLASHLSDERRLDATGLSEYTCIVNIYGESREIRLRIFIGERGFCAERARPGPSLGYSGPAGSRPVPSKASNVGISGYWPALFSGADE